MRTKYDRLKQRIDKLNAERFEMGREKERRQDELDRYVKRHKSLSFDGLETRDIEKLKKMYAYFDSRYNVKWEGGLRCDNRGMRLHFWIDDDPDYLILHLSSTSENICFSGSTSWIVRAETLSDKVNILAKTKKDIQKILKGKEIDCEDEDTFTPFKRLKVKAEVEWDADEEDAPFAPEKDFEVVFTPEELEHFEVLDRSDPKKWSIPKEKFEEWFGDYLTDFTDFCHRGFTYDLTPLKK